MKALHCETSEDVGFVGLRAGLATAVGVFLETEAA